MKGRLCKRRVAGWLAAPLGDLSAKRSLVVED